MTELTIKGKWQNELGSIMNITEFDKKIFSGIYYTSVGEVKKGEGNPLYGTYNVEIWEDKKVVKGIDTTWLLRRFTTSFKNWDGIIIGKDYFVKYEK
jgi:hypothetical protein